MWMDTFRIVSRFLLKAGLMLREVKPLHCLIV
jgi:hypothetical protein